MRLRELKIQLFRKGSEGFDSKLCTRSAVSTMNVASGAIFTVAA